MRESHRALTALGLNVRNKRKALGLSQQHLATKSGLNRTYLSEFERGKRNPNLLTVWRIARALGTSLAALCEGIDQ
jgi:transcriptional regulator with XRE-family HTH domain